MYVYIFIYETYTYIYTYAVAQLFDALSYKPEGRGFESPWGH